MKRIITFVFVCCIFLTINAAAYNFPYDNWANNPMGDIVSGVISPSGITPGVPATEVDEPETPESVKQNRVRFHAEMPAGVNGDASYIFSLYDVNTMKRLATSNVVVTPGDRSFNVFFDVPEYDIGTKFLMKLVSDNGELQFNGVAGKEFVLETYLYTDSYGKAAYQTEFFGIFYSGYIRKGRIKINDTVESVGSFVYGNEVYVAEDFFSKLGIEVNYGEDKWHLKKSYAGLSMDFFKNSTYAWKNGSGYNLKYPVTVIGGKGYFPIKDVLSHFKEPYEISEDYEKITVKLRGGDSEKEKFVNESGVDSKTSYLIWISKADHTVNVFTGSKGNWRLYKSYPCALGAPRTPTIEGQFEYIERLNRWTYANYYCGPVMRFYNGYALHSTLIRYDGTAYDDRVGVDISLGCIRLHPADINELVSIIPFKTRIYITAK